MKREELERINTIFLSEHYEITESDIIMCNNYIDIITRTRNEERPEVGDILEYTTEHGEYYKNAHIDRIDGNFAEICERPSTPFISYNNNKIYLSTSGGSWCKLDISKFRYKGKRRKAFCDWGHCGACCAGSIDFYVDVNVWEYKAENKFGEYTTKDYEKQYIHYLTEEQKQERQSKYIILGAGNAWETLEEYNNYKKLYNGVEFDGYHQNQKVLFTYKEKRMYINEFKYEMLTLKRYNILDNGNIYQAKVCKDEETKTIIIFLCDSYKYDSKNFEQWMNIKKYSEVNDND